MSRNDESAGRSAPRGDSLADKVSLELRGSSEHVEQEPAGRSAVVDSLIDHHEVDAERFPSGHEGSEVVCAAEQPVEVHAGHGVKTAFAGMGPRRARSVLISTTRLRARAGSPIAAGSC